MIDFCGLTPNRAKQLGRRVPLRPDWELVKYDVMYEVCMAKFTQNSDLLSKLLATGDAELIFSVLNNYAVYQQNDKKGVTKK